MERARAALSGGGKWRLKRQGKRGETMRIWEVLPRAKGGRGAGGGRG
jgi:hypothetical protein